MSVNLGSYESYVLYLMADKLREAEHDRLVSLATGPARPIRTRIADWLFAIAARMHGRPTGRFVHLDQAAART